MTTLIRADSDMPERLNTARKQTAAVKALAAQHLGKPATKARAADLQGQFSRTLVVTMKGGDRAVIQLRLAPLDVAAVTRARTALGDVVPDLVPLADAELQRDGVWPYYMSFVPGTTWRRSRAFVTPALEVACARSLGSVLARGFVGFDNSAVDGIALKLKMLQAAADENSARAEQIKAFKDTIHKLVDDVEQLRVLPLFISHADLNHVNILVDDNGEVSGIVDWESSSSLPFGMGISRLHDLFGRFTNGEFRVPDSFEEAERSFWDSLLGGVLSDIGTLLNANLEAVQTSIQIGTLLDVLELEAEAFNAAALKALPKFLTYRIPALRGSDPPYAA